jgi:hypothetical protein
VGRLLGVGRLVLLGLRPTTGGLLLRPPTLRRQNAR